MTTQELASTIDDLYAAVSEIRLAAHHAAGANGSIDDLRPALVELNGALGFLVAQVQGAGEGRR